MSWTALARLPAASLVKRSARTCHAEAGRPLAEVRRLSGLARGKQRPSVAGTQGEMRALRPIRSRSVGAHSR